MGGSNEARNPTKGTVMDPLVRMLGRALAPDIYPIVEEEMQSDAFSDVDEVPQTIRIEDNGSDTTVVSFSSGGFVYAGLPTYALGEVLERVGHPCNRIFLRDIHRVAYHLLPNGEPGGLAYYEHELNKALKALGTRHTYMLGESSGAAAALYFGVRCGAEKVLAITMPYPMASWASGRAWLGNVFNFRELTTDWPSYKDALMISSFSVLAHKTLVKRIGAEQIFNPVETFLTANSRPLVTLVYGARCKGDTTNIAPIAEEPEVTLVPIDSGRHTLWIPLARQRPIDSLIREVFFDA